jgi:trans-aconitate methyltransferase
VDGWHRLFAAKVFGVSRLPCEFVQETDAVGPIYGEIEDVRVDESTVELEGWCIDPDARIDGIELRADEGIAQTSMRIWSEEAARAFPRVSQEASSGFVVKSKWKEEADSPAALEVVALRDQLPIGRMSFRLLPDMFEEGTWPEAELARRLWGTGNSRALAIRGSNCAYDLLTTLGRYRSLESFGSVLDWGCGVGLLQPFLGSYLPDATITGIDFDEDAVQWCRRAGFAGTFSATGVLPPTELPPESFDLVLGNAILPRLRREEQLAWLQELSHLMKSRAYAALSVNGELVRPLLKDADAMTELDREGIYTRPTEPGPASRVGRVATYQTEVFTRQACAGLFDVVVYAAGGVYNQQDLLILRKR